MKIKSLVISVAVIGLSGCIVVTPQKVKGITTGNLCDLVDPKRYASTFKEREIIYAELEARGADCQVYR